MTSLCRLSVVNKINGWTTDITCGRLDVYVGVRNARKISSLCHMQEKKGYARSRYIMRRAPQGGAYHAYMVCVCVKDEDVEVNPGVLCV